MELEPCMKKDELVASTIPRHREDYQPLPIIPPKQDNINIKKSPFMPPDNDEFPPPPEHAHDMEETNLQNLMKDLDAIMAKEDRV
ncbi:Hypothetical predicted protein [Paramuricea clavata]|uniref:Uncharacterized protein n=1 Tax=Paramuricea clavata TaxID=317549 RepID=A0A7D9JJ97_PARCT|nr:Hypothetical predicted protein [Paramuricea clavata]